MRYPAMSGNPSRRREASKTRMSKSYSDSLNCLKRARRFTVTKKMQSVWRRRRTLDTLTGYHHAQGPSSSHDWHPRLALQLSGRSPSREKPPDRKALSVATSSESAFRLFSATPITGGQQPREIWVYRSQNCPPSWKFTPKRPLMIGSGDISNVLDFLRK